MFTRSVPRYWNGVSITQANNNNRFVVNEKTALQLVAVWASVDFLSRITASLSLDVLRRLPDGGKSPDPTHQAYDLVHFSPDGEIPSFRFRQTQLVHTLTAGNSYSLIERAGGYPFRLTLLDPWQVTPYRNEQGRLKYYFNGNYYNSWDILHCAGLGWDGCKGYSVIGMASRAISLGMNLEQASESFWNNAARPSGYFTTTKPVTAATEASLREVFSGANNLGKPMVFDGLGANGAVTWTPLTVNQEDAQFLQSRAYSTEEIARLFGIPPTCIQDYSRATFSNVEESNLSVVMHRLMPLCESIDQEYTLKLFTPEERKTFFVEHNLNSILRGNSQARAEFYTKLFNMGAITVNQILKLENFDNLIPDDEGGNKRFVPLNLTTLDKAGKPIPTVEKVIRQEIRRALKGKKRKAKQPITVEVETKPVLRLEQKAPVIDAVRAVVVDALGRMVRRECQALRRAAKKNELTPSWIADFYADHKRVVSEALAPSIAAYATATGEPIALETFVERMADESIAKLNTAWNADDVEKLCNEWEQNRAVNQEIK